MAEINNVLVQLFDLIEENSGIEFAKFTTNDNSSAGNIKNKEQPYMQGYKNTQDNKVYKYLYDPNLQFDYRFHQRLATIKYKDKNKPWVTLMFTTKEDQPLTNVLSHVYTGYQTFTDEESEERRTYEYKIRRNLVPVQFILISNNASYLYSVTERLSFYFDRFINFHYKDYMQFSDEDEWEFEDVGQATQIRQINFNKLDTEYKGSLVTTGFSFNLVYFVNMYQYQEIRLLERVITEVKIVNMAEPFMICITE